jgi:hypothetical protein
LVVVVYASHSRHRLRRHSVAGAGIAKVAGGADRAFGFRSAEVSRFVPLAA